MVTDTEPLCLPADMAHPASRDEYPAMCSYLTIESFKALCTVADREYVYGS